MYVKIQSTLRLSDPSATLETVGGKGLSLAKMINAGFPIPDGFHITTDAYHQFIEENELQTKILTTLKAVAPEDVEKNWIFSAYDGASTNQCSLNQVIQKTACRPAGTDLQHERGRHPQHRSLVRQPAAGAARPGARR